jgi:hypothetical protein
MGWLKTTGFILLILAVAAWCVCLAALFEIAHFMVP